MLTQDVARYSTLIRYIDDAKAAAGVDADRALSLMLGLGETAIWQYRRLRATPSPDNMYDIAVLGGNDPGPALIYLGSLKTDRPEVLSEYTKIADAVAVA